MRKIDYAILAEILRAAIAHPSDSMPAPDCGNADVRRGAVRAAHRIARNFANRASVNRAEFLRACGIVEPH